jgi:hypothetical protein
MPICSDASVIFLVVKWSCMDEEATVAVKMQ